MQPEQPTQPVPFLVRDPLRDVRNELERLRMDPAKAGPVRMVAAKSKPEANRERREQAIRRAAFELLVAEEIDAASTVFVGIDHGEEPPTTVQAATDGVRVFVSEPVEEARAERLGERWAKAREKRERRKLRRGAR